MIPKNWKTMAIKPCDFVIDVGANIGDLTFQYADMVGTYGSVLAIEPSPKAYEVLTERTSHLKNVFLSCCACGDTKGELEVFHYRHWTLLPVSHQRAEYYQGESNQYKGEFKAEFIRLGDAILGTPSYVKIDVDGGEFGVLRGAENLLRRCRPVLNVEVSRLGLDLFGETPEELFAWMTALGYHGIVCWWGTPIHVTVEDLEEYCPKSDVAPDILFVPEERCAEMFPDFHPEAV